MSVSRSSVIRTQEERAEQSKVLEELLESPSPSDSSDSDEGRRLKTMKKDLGDDDSDGRLKYL